MSTQQRTHLVFDSRVMSALAVTVRGDECDDTADHKGDRNCALRRRGSQSKNGKMPAPTIPPMPIEAADAKLISVVSVSSAITQRG